MTCNYFESVAVLTKLFLAFFDPSTEKLITLRQCLTTFFSTYATNPKHKVNSHFFLSFLQTGIYR
jgi:hypothetical protein